MGRAAAIVVAAVGALGAMPATAEPTFTGFKDVAARSDVIEIRKPLWQDGTLRVGNAVGKVKRRSRGSSTTRTVGLGEVSKIDRYGTATFSVTGADVGGTLSGECGYGRREETFANGDVEVSDPTGPLRMRCEFQRNGAFLGYVDLGAVPPTRELVQMTRRVGIASVGGTRLRLRSAHALDGTRIPVAEPVGYWIDGPDAQAVGAVDTNGFTRVRLALPRDAAQRDAALIAGLAIATFWDPGDADD